MNNRSIIRQFIAIIFVTVMFFSTALAPFPVMAQDLGPGLKTSPTSEPGTYVTWQKQHEVATDTWSSQNLAWEFGPYPNYVILLKNGTEVTDSNFIPVNEDFRS
ncbi:hypothetical protein MUP79_10525 [Candidatus Bathyarchaeota archaeon]|nr:hypothetical protein [Candidatus Bathyarchaeota archaeon]